MIKIRLPFFVILALCLAYTPSLWAKTRLRYANFFPPTHIQSQLAESWCKAVEKRTGGEVVIQYFPAGTLTKAPQTYDGVVQGIADIGMTVLAYSRGRFPVAAAIDLPMGYTSGVQATALANAVFDRFSPKEFNDTRIMFLHAHGPGFIHTRNKGVETLDDLKGLKLRGTGTSGLVQAALGASPVGKSMRECYPMLQKGVVDGSSHPMESNKGWKLAEVVKFGTKSYPVAYTTSFFVVMNKDKWAEIDAASQKAIIELNKEWATKHGAAWDESDKAGLEFFTSKGGAMVDIIDAEAWVDAAKPVIAEYHNSVKKKKFDSQAVVNFIQETMK